MVEVGERVRIAEGWAKGRAMNEGSATYYKYLCADGSATMGTGRWPLPTGEGEPGEWLEVEGEIVPCQNGLHACRKQNLAMWRGPSLYELEYAAPPEDVDEKVVGRKARLVRKLEGWNSTTQRLYAADCAERVLHFFERAFPNDDRPRKAIEAARASAKSQSLREQVRIATANAADAAADAADAANAADAAADAAAAYAAYAAADAADAANAADAAAAYAADADAAAAYAADARIHEREWQSQRILDYAYGRIENQEEK